MTQDARAVSFEYDEVFDPHAAPARQIDARLDGENHAWSQLVVATRRRQPGRFMDLEPDAMPEAVQERRAVARLVDDLTRQRITLAASHARPQPAFSLLLRLDHKRMQLDQAPVERLPEADRTGHVRTVATGARPDIDFER